MKFAFKLAGSEIQAPMGVSVIGGLIFSTLVTLVLIPVLYSLLDDVHLKFKRKNKKQFQ